MTEPTSADPFLEYDAAYVLGALDTDERDAFAAHLVDCADCQARVAELAALPELLALVPAEAYRAVTSPADPVVALLSAARANRRRRRLITLGVGAAAAACLIAATVLIARPSDTTAKPVAVAPPQQTMSAVAAAPIHATVAVTDVAWGTSIKLTCTYDSGIVYPPDEQYWLVVRSRDGQTDKLGSWVLVPGKVTTFPAGTALHKSDIETIVVETSDGKPLLQVSF